MPRYSTKIPRTCETCGKPIKATEYRIADGRGRFCSQSCLWKSRSFNLRPVAERFWAKVDMSGVCWLWTGAIATSGYGAFSVNGKMRNAHRVSYEMTNGPIPDGAFIRHACDNRRCVNPAHLIAGTHQENVNDAVERGRNTRGETSHLSRLTTDDVLLIRRLRIEGVPLAELAARFGTIESNICSIAHRRSWKHIP